MPINRAFQRLKKPMKDGFHVKYSKELKTNTLQESKHY